ncbi:Ankyrin repeats (3 copies) [compost metagenome]
MELNDVIIDAFQAAQSGDASRLKEQLAAYPQLVHAENKEGLTLLGYAAHFGHIAVVEQLLDHGADCNAVSHSKVSYIPSNTALHAAIAGERNIDVIRLLLNRNAQTRIFDSNGHTCLHVAAFHEDNPEIIRLLIEHGADVNARIEGGEPALSLAMKQGNNKVAEFLRQNGALE